MTESTRNPAPRPALRKASDAHVHPALPSGHASTRARSKPRALDALLMPPLPVPASVPFQGSTSDAATRAAGDPVLTGKKVPLEVEVPKKLRKALRDRADARGEELDVVVVRLLARALSDPDQG